jgi:hypothetical protein
VRHWWWKTRDLISLRVPAVTSDPAQEQPDEVGKYQHLYKYLRDRYANRLVLTFAQVEDILGFSLPAPARLERQWWGADGGTAPTEQSDAWILASRTASVNLLAQTVLFERQTAAGLS